MTVFIRNDLKGRESRRMPRLFHTALRRMGKEGTKQLERMLSWSCMLSVDEKNKSVALE